MSSETASEGAVAREDTKALRVFLRERLGSGLSLRRLATEIEMDPGNLAKFLEGKQQSLPLKARLLALFKFCQTPMDRRYFIEIAGIGAFVTFLGRHFGESSSPSDTQRDKTTGDPFLSGARLFQMASDLDVAGQWGAALKFYREAEERFGPGSTERARAALAVVQEYINLGDYESAEVELGRVEQSYENTMDPSTRAIAWTRRGWLAYYQGRLGEAIAALEKVHQIADKWDDASLKDVAHFLGRAFRDAGKL